MSTQFRGMPRYFFHVQGGRDLPDEEGEELPDDKSAGLSAVQVLAELLLTRRLTIWSEPLIVHVEREGIGRLFTLRTSGEQLGQLTD